MSTAVTVKTVFLDSPYKIRVNRFGETTLGAAGLNKKIARSVSVNSPVKGSLLASSTVKLNSARGFFLPWWYGRGAAATSPGRSERVGWSVKHQGVCWRGVIWGGRRARENPPRQCVLARGLSQQVAPRPRAAKPGPSNWQVCPSRRNLWSQLSVN